VPNKWFGIVAGNKTVESTTKEVRHQ